MRGQAFPSPYQTQPLCRSGLHTNCGGPDGESIRDICAHRRDMRRQPWRLGNHSNIDIRNPITPFVEQRSDMGEKLRARRIRISGIAVRKMFADIAQRRGAKQGIA